MLNIKHTSYQVNSGTPSFIMNLLALERETDGVAHSNAATPLCQGVRRTGHGSRGASSMVQALHATVHYKA